MDSRIRTVVALAVIVFAGILLLTACAPQTPVDTGEEPEPTTALSNGESDAEEPTTEPQAPSEETEPTTAADSEPQVERIEQLDVAQGGNPVSLDCGEWAALDEGDILRHFNDPLFQFDRSNEINGVLIEEWEMVSPTEWMLYVRQGVPFHDEQYGELTAEDIVASIEHCFRPDARRADRNPEPIQNSTMEIVDDYTIRFSMPDPGSVALPNYLADVYVTAAEYIEAMGGNTSLEPMGTGPFEFVEWQPNVQIVGERFEDYWGDEILIDRVVWRIIPDEFTRRSEFTTGGIDILPGVLPDWLPEFETNPSIRVETTFSARYVFIVLPVREQPYDDIRVRQALNYAVNQEEIVETLFLGIGAIPQNGITHAMMPSLDPDHTGYPYDPERAMELLDEARADGVEIGTLTLHAPNDRYALDQEIGEAVAGYWREIGLDVEFIPESRSVLFPRVQSFEQTDPFLFGSGNLIVRAEFPYQLWMQKQEDPRSRGMEYAAGPDEWDALIARAGELASDDPEYVELIHELDEIYTEYAPWVFLINYVDLYGVSSEVEWQPYPTERRFFYDARPAS